MHRSSNTQQILLILYDPLENPPGIFTKSLSNSLTI
jgi:hypothetical protein